MKLQHTAHGMKRTEETGEAIPTVLFSTHSILRHKRLTHPLRSRVGQTHCLLLVLEHFLDLLITADLLHALPLDGALPDLLQEAVGSGKALQD